MKKILVVLAGFLFCAFHTSVWADCGEENTAKFLSPGPGSVLINGAPFVLQWLDNFRCLGKRIRIDMIRESDGRTVRRIQPNVENLGYCEIVKVRAPVTHEADRYQFRIKSSRQEDRQIESKPFTVTNVGVPGGKDDEGIKFAPYISIRDALTRITALEEFVEELTTQVTGGSILQPELPRATAGKLKKKYKKPAGTKKKPKPTPEKTSKKKTENCKKKPYDGSGNACWDKDCGGWVNGENKRASWKWHECNFKGSSGCGTVTGLELANECAANWGKPAPYGWNWFPPFCGDGGADPQTFLCVE